MVPDQSLGLEPSVPKPGYVWSNPRIRRVQSPDTMVPIPGYDGSKARNCCHPFVFTFFSKYLRKALASRFTRRMMTMSTSAVP